MRTGIHGAGIFLDRVLDSMRNYIEGLSTDQLEMYFYGLWAIGLILSLYLLYSIYRRSFDRPGSGIEQSKPGVAGATGLAELLRDRELPPEEARKKKHNAWRFSNP